MVPPWPQTSIQFCLSKTPSLGQITLRSLCQLPSKHSQEEPKTYTIIYLIIHYVDRNFYQPPRHPPHRSHRTYRPSRPAISTKAWPQSRRSYPTILIPVTPNQSYHFERLSSGTSRHHQCSFTHYRSCSHHQHTRPNPYIRKPLCCNNIPSTLHVPLRQCSGGSSESSRFQSAETCSDVHVWYWLLLRQPQLPHESHDALLEYEAISG